MIWGVQIQKIAKRPDVLAFLLAALIVPMGFTALALSGSGTLTVTGSTEDGVGITVVSALLALVKQLMIPHIFLAVIVSSLVAGEISSGVDAVFASKEPRRARFVLSKYLALVLVVAAALAMLVTATALCWYFLLRGSEMFPRTEFFSTSNAPNNASLAFIGLSFLELLTIATLFFAISLFIKRQYLAMLACFASVVLQKLLEGVELVRGYLPTYISSGNGVTALDGPEFASGLLFSGFLLLMWLGAALAVVIVRYSKMDIVPG
jgi:ABC-type transport system involved in multi-copper enzyme maturation permease subunit